MNANCTADSRKPQRILHWQTESLTERLAHIIPLINALTALAFRLGVTMNFTRRPSSICVAFAKVGTRRARAITATWRTISSASKPIIRTIISSTPWWQFRRARLTSKSPSTTTARTTLRYVTIKMNTFSTSFITSMALIKRFITAASRWTTASAKTVRKSESIPPTRGSWSANWKWTFYPTRHPHLLTIT